MKKQDVIFCLGACLIFLPFVFSTQALEMFKFLNKEYGMLMSFAKFAVLATAGEALALRVRTGSYYQPGFGLLPKAIIWGLLGFTIKIAFIVFGKGSPEVLHYFGIQPNAITAALAISVCMNLIYGPVLMTLHKITDLHIALNQGKMRSLWTSPNVADLFAGINWQVHWNFVLKKTIPLFWIPAHTITFILPEDFQVLFAAILGIALGLILAFAGLKTAK